MHTGLGAQPGASRAETEEKRIRGTADRVADWVLLVRGDDPDPRRHARDHDMAEEALRARGVRERQAVGLYRLMHCITDVDLAAG